MSEPTYARDTDNIVKMRFLLPGGLEVIGWEPFPLQPNLVLGYLIVRTPDGDQGSLRVERFTKAR
jgi:hypothetical protein